MASRVSFIRIGGYTLFEGSEVRVKDNKMYTAVNGTVANNINMLTQCVMQVTALYEGTDAYNPIQLKWKSGPAGSYNGGGFIKTSQVVSGSGTPNNFIVNYNPNGGSGSMPQSTFIYGQSNKLSVCTLKKLDIVLQAGVHTEIVIINGAVTIQTVKTDGIRKIKSSHIICTVMVRQ